MKRFVLFLLPVIFGITVGGSLIFNQSPQALWRRAAERSGIFTGQTSSAPAQPVVTLLPQGEPDAPDAEEITGPYRWRNVEIGGTGFITGVVFHPKKPGLVYARTDIGGAYRWAPKSMRWIPLLDWVGNDDWTLFGIESLALDPQDAQRVYLAAGTYTNNWGKNGAILRSTDQGKTWEKTPVPFKFGGNEDGRAIGERLAVDPNLSSRLFLGTRNNGLWKSDDFGKTWQQDAAFPVKEKTDGAGVGFVLFDAKSGNRGTASSTIYVSVATTKTSLYRSTDAGASWQEIAGQTAGLMPHHGVLAPDGTLYLTYSDKPGPNGVTNGAVWKLDTTTGQWTDITPLKPDVGGEGKFGYSGLAVDATDPKTLMVATLDRWNKGDDILRSKDGGAHWSDFAQKATNAPSAAPYLSWGRAKTDFGHWIGDVEINPFDNKQAFYVTGATMWATDDLNAADAGLPTTWKVHAQGIEESAVTSLLSPPSGPSLISGLLDVAGFRHDDLAVSPAGGMWTNPTMSSVSGLDFAQMNPDLVVRVGSGSKVRGAFSTDGAKSWQPFGSEPAMSQGTDENSHCVVAVAADGSSFVWVAPDGSAYVSQDRGTNWKRCEGLGAKVEVIADRVNPKTFYALSPEERKLFVSTDGGNTFAEQSHELPAGAKALRAVPSREGDLWLTADWNGLWRSTNGGAQFQKITEVANAEVVGFGKAAPGGNYDAIYLVGVVGKTHGVYRSDDEGAKWTRINDDQHRYGWIGKVITGDPRLYGRVYFGTNGRGIIYGDPVMSQGGTALISP
ncbi:MAG: carbohydrate-binding protein [Chthoniobacterales bacterium]